MPSPPKVSPRASPKANADLGPFLRSLGLAHYLDALQREDVTDVATWGAAW